MQLHALNNNLIVELIQPNDTLASGIILAQKALDKSRWAIVKSVGEGLPDINGNRHKPRYKPGDIVFIFRHAPVRISAKDEPDGELYAIGEGDVWCTIDLVANADGTVTTRLYPAGNFLHIDPIIEERHSKTAGGIFLPEQVQEKPTRAKVLAVGPGQHTTNGTNVMPPVSPGDIVRFVQHQWHEVTFTDLGAKDAKQYLVQYQDVLAIEGGNEVEVNLTYVDVDRPQDNAEPMPETALALAA